MKLARRAVTVLALALLVAFSAAEAQQPGKVQRIGYLSLASDTGSARDYFAAFRDGLRALGYVDGENIVIEPRHADGRPERLPELAGELIRLKVDVLVTFGNASAAKQATNTVPIVFITLTPTSSRSGSSYSRRSSLGPLVSGFS